MKWLRSAVQGSVNDEVLRSIIGRFRHCNASRRRRRIHDNMPNPRNRPLSVRLSKITVSVSISARGTRSRLRRPITLASGRDAYIRIPRAIMLIAQRVPPRPRVRLCVEDCDKGTMITFEKIVIWKHESLLWKPDTLYGHHVHIAGRRGRRRV